MSVEMVDVEGMLLREAEDRRVSQKSMALTYAFGIVGSEPVDWARVNRAILAHRSKRALGEIKRMAWKHVDERRARGTVAS